MLKATIRFRALMIFVYTIFGWVGWSQELTFHDLRADYGVYFSLYRNYRPELFGREFSITTAHFLTEKSGYRVGFSWLQNLEGADDVYTIPMHFCYRTKLSRSQTIGPFDSLADFIFQLLTVWIPRNVELHVGPRLGYIEPDHSVGYVYNNGQVIHYGYRVQNRFLCAIDGGFKLNYKIWRFRVGFAPSVSYQLTRNFVYFTDDQTDINDQFEPKWFFRLTGGVAFVF